MDIFGVLERFRQRRFIIYGGDSEFATKVQEYGDVLYQYVSDPEEGKIPIQQSYKKFEDDKKLLYDTDIKDSPLGDTILIVVGRNGNFGGKKAEIQARMLLGSPGYRSKIIIFSGYKDFIVSNGEDKDEDEEEEVPEEPEESDRVIGNMVKEEFINGCIVVPKDDRVVYLQEMVEVCNLNVDVKVPLENADLESGSEFYTKIQPVLPYIHLISKIKDLKDEYKKVVFPDAPYDDSPPDVVEMDDISKQMDYESTKWTSAVHWGQRKLLLAEIEFFVEALSKYASEIQSDDPVFELQTTEFLVVYVGAAPGSTRPYLLELFNSVTSIEFHLWDRPDRFDKGIQQTSNIKIVPQEFADPSMTGDKEGFFTDVVADNYVKYIEKRRREDPDSRFDVLFISDIRDEASDEAVVRDMRMQEEWVKKLQPYASQLKFRLPFSQQEAFTYLDGKVYTQAWSRVKSSEGRLISFRPFVDKDYDPKAYDRAMSYINTVSRMKSYDLGFIINTTAEKYGCPNEFLNEIPKYIPMPKEGLCTCGDCSREVQIIAKYLGFRNSLGAGIDINEQKIEQYIRDDTLQSRLKSSKDNIRTLWNRTTPKATPVDRIIMVMFKKAPWSTPDEKTEYRLKINEIWRQRNEGVQEFRSKIVDVTDMNILNIRIVQISDMFFYGDGLTPEEIIDFLLRKEVGVPFFDTKMRPIQILQSVLGGKIPRFCINFHTDFNPDYNAKKDFGIFGMKKFNQYKQGYVIRNYSSQDKIDPVQQLMIFIIGNTVTKPAPLQIFSSNPEIEKLVEKAGLSFKVKNPIQEYESYGILVTVGNEGMFLKTKYSYAYCNILVGGVDAEQLCASIASLGEEERRRLLDPVENQWRRLYGNKRMPQDKKEKLLEIQKILPELYNLIPLSKKPIRSYQLTIPKGRKHEGETGIQTAIRECKEETGLEFTEKQLSDPKIVTYTASDRNKYVQHIYEVKLRNKPYVRLETEFSETLWISPETKNINFHVMDILKTFVSS